MKSLIIEKTSYAKVDGKININDQLIPNVLREYCGQNKTRHISLLIQDNTLWVTSKLKVNRIHLYEYKEFKVCFMTPAKGRGFVAIQAWPQITGTGCVSIIEFGSYSQKALAEAVEAASQLKELLGYELELDDWGSDY